MFGGWSAAGLRLRFKPSSRISQSMLTISPWVDVLLVGVFMVVVTMGLTITPGVPVKLPEAPFIEGIRHGIPMVLLAVEGDTGVECLLFIDDERFRLGDERQEALLSEAISKRVRVDGRAEAVLHADELAPHGMVMRAVNVARSAGIRLVNVATRPESVR